MDSLEMKRFDIQLTDIWLSTQKQLIEMSAKMNGLTDCLVTTEVIITQLSDVNQTLSEVFDMSVQKSPEFKPFVGLIRKLEESIEREKDILKTKKASLNDINSGNNVQELIHRWRQCVNTRDQSIQTDDQYIESSIRSIDSNANNEAMDDRMAIDDDNNEESINTSYWETIDDKTSDVWSEDSMNVSLDSSAIHMNANNNDSESEVSTKTTATDGDRKRDDNSGGRRTRGKSLTTNGNRIVRQRGRPKGQSTSGPSPDGLYACYWPKCKYSTKWAYLLVQHSNAHNNIKPYACEWPGCQYRTNWPSSLSSHGLKHRNNTYKYGQKRSVTTGPHFTIDRTCVKQYVCQWPECGFATKWRPNIVGHTNAHQNIKPYACTRPECQYRTSWPTDFAKHSLKHRNNSYLYRLRVTSGTDGHLQARPSATSGPLFTVNRSRAKPYVCQWPDCRYSCNRMAHIVSHTNAHRNYRPYACRRPGCEYRASDTYKLSTHRRRHNNPYYKYRPPKIVHRFPAVTANTAPIPAND